MTEEKYGDSYGEKFRQYEDKIKELEKENEALKGQMSLHEGILWNDVHKLEKENASLKDALEGYKQNAKWCDKCDKFADLKEEINKIAFTRGDLEKENAELKTKVGLSIDCEKAQKNGELCLGYGGDEDEPCEQCKNCIKCECGYYQLGETEKDEQLTNATEIIKKLKALYFSPVVTKDDVKRQDEILTEAEQFIKE